MDDWGVRAFKWAFGLSVCFFALYFVAVIAGCLPDSIGSVLRNGRVPWSLTSSWSVVAACLIIGVYLAINAAFLQPYLGDAARYFRNSPANVAVRREIRKEAVKTLDQLHRSRDYDRIIVVAHSLGTAVAYDMLRAYYSRICDQIPIDKHALDPQFKAVDKDPLDCSSMRVQGRQLIGKLAASSEMLADTARQDLYKPAKGDEVDAWLVTDFVTLGSPLTHACYFMVNGKNQAELDHDFASRVREREFPTCPPQELDGDGRIAFKDPNTKQLRLHHGGAFGMTRWTNLYFKMTDIFWGDAIGGKVAELFGECVNDVQVWTDTGHSDGFFKHTSYWKTDCKEQRKAPHIQALIEAIDLPDKDKAPAPKS